MPALLLERCRSMNETEIRKYSELMKELGLTGLEITEDKNKVRLERTVSPSAGQEILLSQVAEKSPAAVPEEKKDYISVNSTIVGVFYAAPTEKSQPYVSIGDHVKKGQTLCIVEAMKLMNEITAEEDGVISEICVTNGQVVEYGTELFRMER